MPKEGRFYVEYMGWKETRGLYGSEFTDPIVSKLLARHRATKHPHRMTIKINRDELQISQEKSGSSKSQKIKYPAQPMCDVSYVSQCAPPNTDVVCCIFLGYNMYTQCAAHVHAYRFDSPDTATIFVKLVNSYIEQSEYRQRILAMERDLAELGHVSNSRTVSATNGNMPLSINPDMGSDGGSYGSHSPNSSDSGLPRSYGTAEEALKQRKDIVIKRTPSQKKQQPTSKLFSNIQDELAHKLSLQQEKEAAILLPPKDYDTIVRRHGHLSIRSKVVTKTQPSIMGAGNIFENKAARASAEDNNNKSTRQRTSGGYILQKTKSTSSSIDDDADSAGSSQSAEEPSVYGLYKGLQKSDSLGSAQEMAMWSPEFSFGHDSTSTMSSGFHGSSSGSQGLRRTKVSSIKR